jgi:DNA polymerase-3 subunit gamma/tau
MAYTVLARRYRSESFEDVVGQEAITQTLQNAINTERIAHAYLFTGTRGVGKTTMARILAKALNCLSAEAPTADPCKQCESCQAVAEGSDIDVIEIDAASNTGVDHIRELRQNAIYRPARARFKIYIIDEVHMLSTSAFNALLKTLEEPPEHVKFILATTEANKILPTILSRCQRFDFRNIQPDDIAGQLRHVLAGEGVEAEEALIKRVARLAYGSMRDALSLLDQILSMSEGTLKLDLLTELVGTQRSEHIVALAEAVSNSDPAAALIQLDVCLCEGLTLEQTAQGLQDHFRDLMILRSCGPDSSLVELDDAATRETALNQSQRFDEAALVYTISVLEELRRAIKSSGAGRALLEAAIVRLTAGSRFSDTRALLDQLQNMPTLPVKPKSAPATRPRPTKNASTTDAEEKPPELKITSTPKAQAPDHMTIEYIKDQWDDILLQLADHGAQHIKSYFASSQPRSWDPPQLSIGFRQPGMIQMLSANSEKISEFERVLSTILNQTITCKLTLLESETETVRPERSPGAKPSQAEMRAAMTDPQVKTVQEVLGGSIKTITRLEA